MAKYVFQKFRHLRRGFSGRFSPHENPPVQPPDQKQDQKGRNQTDGGKQRIYPEHHRKDGRAERQAGKLAVIFHPAGNQILAFISVQADGFPVLPAFPVSRPPVQNSGKQLQLRVFSHAAFRLRRQSGVDLLHQIDGERDRGIQQDQYGQG